MPITRPALCRTMTIPAAALVALVALATPPMATSAAPLEAQSAVAKPAPDAENGAITVTNEEVVRIPAFRVRPVNTIGAGDCFNAGFIASQSKGVGILESIRYANATAAVKISATKPPTLDAINDLLTT